MGSLRYAARCTAVLGIGMLGLASIVHADDGGYFANYFKVVDASQEAQPHWVTPLNTTTPRLEQEVRYDFQAQQRSGGVLLNNSGANKGLELIPFAPIEIIMGLPSYETLTRPGKKEKTGFADEAFTVKYRMFSGNEEHGNYIVTAFLGMTVPTGGVAFSADETIYTPTLAFGKGWGTREQGFDIQSTIAMSFPEAEKARLGSPIVWNTSFQGHVFKTFWPEVELQYTHFVDGPNDGKNQVIMTEGVVLGRFPIVSRLRALIGVGHQDALTSFHTYNHAWIISLRAPF
jgi:hypothetical protein